MGKLTSSKPNNHNDSATNNNTAAQAKQAQRAKDTNTINYPTKRLSKRREVNTSVSASMTMVINNAAQTARLVLDHHATEENSSVASHTSFSSTRSIPSQRLGSDDGMSLSGGEEDDYDEDVKGMDATTTNNHHHDGGNLGSSSNSIMLDDDNKLKVQNSTSLDASFVSGSTFDVPGSSPPPLAAFSNLPMSRGFSSSPHNNTNNNGNNGDGTDNGDAVLLAEGKVVEVTNHFDAAAAISAALASSHLAQATGGVGELQMPLSHLAYNPVQKHHRRRSSSDSSGDNLQMALTQQPFQPKHRRSSSDGPYGDDSVVLPRRSTVDASSISRSAANDKMQPYKRTSSSDSYVRVKKGLPTPAEAAAEMRQRRTSYESLDESDRGASEMVHKTDEVGDVETTGQQAESVGEKEATDEQQMSKKNKESDPKERNGDQKKRISQLSDDSVSFCSSSGYENESNTSSYGSNTYGSNTFGSTISPITMTGFSSEEGKRNKSSNNEGGMLGNLRQTSAYKSIPSDNSYDTASCDEEYSMNCGDDTGLLGKNTTTTLRQNSSKKSKSVRIASAAEVISSTSSPAFIRIETQKASVRFSEEKEQSVQSAIKPSNPPTSADQRHVSLFESFDRNWEQAVEGKSNPQLELGLGEKCLASFATLFETKKNIGDKKRAPLFRWWVDDNVLGSGEEDIKTLTAKDHDQTENPKIPIAVVRMMWKVCLFEPNDHFDSEQAEYMLDSVQQTLVNDLCYLEKIDTSTCSCFRLSLGAYTDYGRYIMRRSELEGQIASWHGKIALSLRQTLLHSKGSDGATIIQRYAARSLPRHAAFGILKIVESVPADPTAETCEELWKGVFESLLCNNDFIKARFDLLGRGFARSSVVDESLNKSAVANTQLIESIKQSRDSDINFVVSTTAQLRDIEWCATVCLPNCEKKESSSDEPVSTDSRKSGEVSFNSYLSAFTKWRGNLFDMFCVLHDSGKVTVCHDISNPIPAKMSLSCSVTSSDEANSFSRTDNSVDVAQSLLDKGDAWTNKDSSSKIFKAGSMKGKGAPRKGRRRRGDNKEEKSTPLAQVLKIDINDLRCAISLGRSLLCMYEALEKVDTSTMKPEDAKFASECLRREQLACLSRAVEIFSCCANTLLQIQSEKLDKLDEEDLDETVLTALGPELCLQSFALVRETSRPLLAVTGILASTAWNYLGKLVGSSYQSQSDPSRHSMLACLERAVLILGSPKSMITNRPQMKTLFAPLAKYKHFLQSNINHSIGVELYESGQFEKAAAYLDEASQIRRKLIDDIRGHLEENNQVVVSKGINPLSSLPEVIPEAVVTNALEYAVGHCCTLLPRKGVDKTDADDIELGLSLTLEYSALTHHAIKKYQSALTFFQEALILRTMRVGKHSLDVASLHFNMGVVYDDLSQYDSAISRYHESLRIRLDHLEKDLSSHGSALEETVLLTLKCMGNVYKVVDDIDDAICCYVKALEMLNRKYARHRDSVDEWCIMGLRLDLAIPVPSIMFNEMKKRQIQTDMNWRYHFQAINKKALCHYFAEETELSPRSASSISKIKKELVKMHNSVIALVQQKKHADDENAQKAFAKFGGSSMLLATIPSELQGGGDTFEVALMNSSFGLGKIRLGQTRYEEAADLFEVALRSKWVLDPVSSSDSDSEFSLKSRSSRSSRKKQVKSVNEDVPEEGQLYYSLGMANAALDDHDRAVRCFLTALRYLRRSLKMVDSQEVARVLFDCATSYYYICDFDQALSLWGECLRILKTHDEKVSVPSRQGICLYCIVLARCSLEKDDAETFSLLNEAQTLLSDCTDKTILAYMEFLTGHFLQRAAAQIPTRCRSRLPTNMRLVPKGSSLEDGMSWKQMCSSALSLFDQVKNECWFDIDDIDEGADEVKNLPLSAHLSLKKGQVYEMLGSIDQALNFYMDAVNFYRIACGHENVYAASVLHCMGMLCASSHKSDDHALTYFNEALTIRRNILGGNDCSVAESLYCSASVLARLNRYESSMERYHEALRIQMSAFGQGSKEVAFTLAGMGQCHYSYRAYDLARTCLLGALRVRKHRVSQLSDDDDDSDISTQSNRDSLYEEEVALGGLFFGLGNIHMQLGDHAQAMQNFIESRDMRWRHVGGGSTDKILDRYLSGSSVDEDELLGLAHCLHNIGLLFDMKEEYHRSLPHYDEALKIKNVIAGFSSSESTALLAPASVNPKENVSLVLRSLEEDLELPQVTKATLSVSMTHKKMASIYAKQNKLGLALFHYTNALRIQRQVLGKDHFVTAAVLTSMGNVLSRTANKHSESAALCYNESLRISRQRFGPNHEKVASALFNIASLYDSNANFDKATHYYNRALSVYKRQYSQELRVRFCSGLIRPISHPRVHDDDAVTEMLSNGDEIILNDSSAPAKNHLNEQYKRVAYALRRARRQEAIQRGDSSGSGSCIDDDWWLTFEVLVFQFVEMFSSYVVDPANSAVRKTIESAVESIEAAAAEAVITAADAVDYSFLLQLQD